MNETTFYQHFEEIKMKPLQFKNGAGHYMIEGGQSAWSLYESMATMAGDHHWVLIGTFSNTHSSSECVFNGNVLGKFVSVKVKMEDFKLVDQK